MKLSVISMAQASHWKVLRPYPVECVDTVGAFGNEPFALRFENTSDRPVEVLLSVDGRNVLTGAPADLFSTDDKRFLLHASSPLVLEAWAETTTSGARFVFTHEAEGVASHTPGSSSAIGLISAAVFTEGASGWGYRFPSLDDLSMQPLALGGLALKESSRSAVGAGNSISQFLTTTQGLRKPVYSQLVTVRHLWWDDLVARLEALGVPSRDNVMATADSVPWYMQEKQLADLGSTPRQPTTITLAEKYARFV